MGILDIFNRSKKNDGKKYIDEYNCTTKKGIVECEEVYLNSSVIEKLNKKYISFDIETTGLNPNEDRVIEVGAVLFENGEPIKKFTSLVNACKKISLDAMKINNISNEMLQDAPNEKDVYSKFIEFIDEALLGETIICAHNAGFDISFLKNTLERLGYNANIKYIDTLRSSREIIHGLENYKQATIAKYFNITNEKSHRAVYDAEVCGNILWNLLKCEINEKCATQENNDIVLDNYEKILFAYIVDLINKKGYDTEYVCARKKANGYIVVGVLLFGFFEYKYTQKGKYIIMKNKYIDNIDLPKEPCTITDGGSDFTRVYFNSLDELNILDNSIILEYEDANKLFKDYCNRVSRNTIIRILKSQFKISTQEAEKYVKEEKNNKELENYCNEIKIKKQISRNEITIKPINSRIPISEIEIIGCYNWEEGWEDKKYEKWKNAEEYFEKANELKQNGKYDEAINFLDIAREKGYITEYLYECYAMIYHKLKDWDNEIDILEEGMKFFTKYNGNVSILTARRDKAVQSKYLSFEKERLQLEKAEKRKQKEEIKERNLKEKQEKVKIEKNLTKQPITGRAIIQMDDNGTVIRQFISIAEAVRETGINSKSIRDAAKGVQKHAGGYCWKYEDEMI